jgi:imidazolonepropionase-like amidohydrolase
VGRVERGGQGRRYVRINERLLATYDSARAAELYRRLAHNHTWQTPTLINWYTNAFGEADSLTRARLPLMPAYIRRWWDPAVNVHLKEQTPEFVELRKRLFANDLEIVRQMAREGVELLAGTDQGGNPYCYPGFSLHDELAILVSAGLSPLKALQTATLNPARFQGVADSLGSIGPGKIADLVLLDANPLDDIRHTTRIAAVFVRGRLLDSTARARIFAEARSGGAR